MSEAGGEHILFVFLSSSSSGSEPPPACVGPSRLVPDTGRLRDIGLARGQEGAGEWGGKPTDADPRVILSKVWAMIVSLGEPCFST